MCGINGFYSKSLSTFNNAILRMNSAISYRGPDNSGVWIDKNLGIVLGHQRLSIIDLSEAGNQPMQSCSGRFILTYNGEVYNHLEIRKELEQSNPNIKWKGSSDTETLLEAIDFWGIKTTLKKTVGMFAFGIWDKKNCSLTLAKDRMGEKPLYYGWQGEGDNKVFIFGSELKSLKVHPSFAGKINRDSIALQLRHNCIPAPYSIYQNIYKLYPGHYLHLNEKNLKKGLMPAQKAYWSTVECAINGNNNQLKICEFNIQKNLESQLKLSVKQQMISDAPIGAFLSGGIDSSLIVALMQSQSRYPVKTFTIGFDETGYSEAQYAKKIAKHLGTNHSELYISAKTAMEVIPNLPLIYDEPFSDSSQIPTFLVSQFAKKQVKVALSGDGGDELFCGYNRYIMYQKFLTAFNLMPSNLRKSLAFVIQSISPKNLNNISKFFPGIRQYSAFGDKMHKFANILKVKSLDEIYNVLTSHWLNPNEVVINSKEPGTLLTEFKPELRGLNSEQQMMVLDLITYLPNDILVKIDRAAMASSLETRAPFLNHKLLEYVWKIPQSLKLRNGHGKWILKKILNQYVPKNLTERPKMGFGIPIDIWLRGPLRDWAENLLNEKKLQKEGFFNPRLVRDKWSEHLSGNRNLHTNLWDILMFQAWADINK